MAARRADELGEDIARAYWLQFPTYCLGHEFDDAVLVSARLLAVGRIAAALDLLSSYSEQSGDAGYAEAILTAFEAAIEGPDDPELHHLDPYQTEILVKHLARERHALGVNRVARIEWYFLSLLGFNPDAPTLHAMLSEDPAFFVEILSKVYRSNDASEHEPATDLEAHEAENADRLLHAWKICPGVNSDGTIDPERLRSWVNDARAILAEVGRAKIGDEKIGEALAAAPSDLDGTWPCQAVRDLLEELQNDDVDCGLQIKIFNNRGVTSRSLDEGGMQDIELSKNHRASQHRFLARWPRTGTIMRQLADTYESYARSEETEAERRRRGLDH